MGREKTGRPPTRGEYTDPEVNRLHFEVTFDLDDVPDGSTYQRVLATDISAGHIKLTATTLKDGDWYDESGVDINAVSGITLYGTNQCLTTRATKAGTVQCYVGSDGYIYAGAGAVWLGADGLTIKRTAGGDPLNFILQYGAGVVGNVYPISGGMAILGNTDILVGTSTNGGIYIHSGAIDASIGDDDLYLEAEDELYIIAADRIGIAAGAVTASPLANEIYLKAAGDIEIDSDSVINLLADTNINIVPAAGYRAYIDRLETTNSDVTVSRAIGTVYQNTGSFPLLVHVTVYMTGTVGASAYVEEGDTTPDILTAYTYKEIGAATAYNTLTFLVPIGAYYTITKVGAGTLTLSSWIEASLGG